MSPIATHFSWSTGQFLLVCVSLDRAAIHDGPQQRRHDSEVAVVHRTPVEGEGVSAAELREEEGVGST